MLGGDSTGGTNINFISTGVTYRFGSLHNEPVTAPPIPTSSNQLELSETVGVVFFEHDSSHLSPAMREILQPILKRLQAYPQDLLKIESHTDSLGTESYNLKLAERRGMSVKNYFVSNGITNSRITVNAKGETMPIADNHTSAGRAQNRRARLIVISIKHNTVVNIEEAKK